MEILKYALPTTVRVACWLTTCLCVSASLATEVPIAGFQPLVGLTLTNEYKNENAASSFFISETSSSPGGNWLSQDGQPHFELALLDTGAGVSLITADADLTFDLEGNGFDGTALQQIGGATGQFFAEVSDPLGTYATGLASRIGADPMRFPTVGMPGQTSSSILTLPAESPLPNILGLTFASQYATRIHSDQPQIFQHNGRTVRTPEVVFDELGSGGEGMRAPLRLKPNESFLQPPFYVLNFDSILSFDSLTENPQNPTNIQGGLFLTVDISKGDTNINKEELFFDTGADVTVVSELTAVQLGFDVQLDEPEFTVPVLGSGGTLGAVPGFFVDELSVATIGGPFVAKDVPVIVLDVTDTSSPGNIVPGIVGTNIFAGRNVVIDPKPAIGGGGVGPSMYISEPVTNEGVWIANQSSADWNAPSNWISSSVPDVLTTVRLDNTSSSPRTAVISGDAIAWDLLMDGGEGPGIALHIGESSSLTTFSGVVVHENGQIHLDGGLLDAQFIEVLGGAISGTGTLAVGNGPIPGQVEIRRGEISPGSDGIGELVISGGYSHREDATLEVDILNPSSFDQLVVDGEAAISGTLSITASPDYVPPEEVGPTDRFLLIEADDLAGVFDTVIYNGQELEEEIPFPLGSFRDHVGDGLFHGVDYSSSHVELLTYRALPGDADGNGFVEFRDFLPLADNFGMAGDWTTGDFTGDGLVQFADFLILSANFGREATAAAAVPEPSCWTLAVFAVLGLRRTRSRRHSRD